MSEITPTKAIDSGAYRERGVDDRLSPSAAEVVVAATPIDLAAVLGLFKPVVRVRYEFAEADDAPLGTILDAFAATIPAQRGR